MSETADNTESQQPNTVADPAIDDEDSLDNFFKKKDKKGKKKKTKKSDKGASEDKEISKAKKKEFEIKKDTENSKEEGKTTGDQEEWIDYEDESERDYSDLKIQNLQMNDNLSEQVAVEVPEYDEAGELILPKEDSGPWKKRTMKQKPTVIHEPKPAPEEPVKKVGVYRPPQARQTKGNSLTPSVVKRGRKQQAPEINNEMDFPSLSAASEDTIVHQGFEVVKAGGKSSTPWRSQHQQAKASEIKLGNQFAALNTGR